MKLKNNGLLYALGVIAVVAIIIAFINLTVFYILIGVAAFLGIFWACYNWKWVRYATLVICALGLTGATVYCGVSLDTYYGAEGGVFGKISNIFNTNQVEEVEDLTFDFSNVEMLATGNAGEYSAQISRDKTLKIDTTKTFGVYVNDSPCGFVETGADYVRANYDYVFYGEEKNEILKDTLQFRFALNKNSTEFTIKTQGGETAVRLWNYYFAKNNFVVSIKPTNLSYSSDNSNLVDGQVDYALANFYEEESKVLTQIYHLGDSVEFPSCDLQNFLGWSTDKNSVVNTFRIYSHTNFYAYIGESPVYTVKYVAEGKEVAQQRVLENSKLNAITAPSKKGYAFKQYVDSEGNAVDNNYVVTSDLVLTAEYEAEYQTITIMASGVYNSNDKERYVMNFTINNENVKILSNVNGKIVFQIKSGQECVVNYSCSSYVSVIPLPSDTSCWFRSIDMDSDATNQISLTRNDDKKSGQISISNINSEMLADMFTLNNAGVKN